MLSSLVLSSVAGRRKLDLLSCAHKESPLRILITSFMDGRTSLKLWELPTAQKMFVHSHRRYGLNLPSFRMFIACCSKKPKQTAFELSLENYAFYFCPWLFQSYRQIWQIFSCGAAWKCKKQNLFLKLSSNCHPNKNLCDPVLGTA